MPANRMWLRCRRGLIAMTSYIVAAKRTAVVPKGGAFSDLSLHELAAPVIQAIIERAGLSASQIDEVIVGNALGAGGNPARVVALASGLPEQVAGLSIDRQCCSGLDALITANALIKSGQAQVVIAGGVESYSQRPLRSKRIANSNEYQPYTSPPFTPWPDRDPEMAQAADKLATQMDISRQLQDDWAINSHAKAIQAKGYLQNEIVPINEVAADQFTRNLKSNTCRRAKVISGSISSANTAVEADAAAFCLMVSESVHNKLQKTLSGNSSLRSVKFVGGNTIGADPCLPGLAPVHAIERVLRTHKLSVSNLEHAEIMEAFAVQAMACIQQTKISNAICNLAGGALARGHPIGASGAILAVRLLNDMASANVESIKNKTTGNNAKRIGLAAIAAAGGLGSAIVLESVVS